MLSSLEHIDVLYGFIYECANLIKNLYDYDNYVRLVIKLCSEFVMPIINITKTEHEKEYNEHIKYIINNLERDTNIFDICSYLMNICCERYLKLSQDEYLKIKDFVDNNIDIIEYAFAPVIDILIYVKSVIVIIIASIIIIIGKKFRIFSLAIYIVNCMKKL